MEHFAYGIIAITVLVEYILGKNKLKKKKKLLFVYHNLLRHSNL